MSVEADVTQVLLALATCELAPGNPERGRHALEGDELVDAAGFRGHRLKDAVDILEDRELIDRKKFVGDDIGYICLTAKGRREAERIARSTITMNSDRVASPETTSIFYSWQRDLPNATNRGLIQDALDAALGELKQSQPAVSIAADRDTQGVPGSPDIAATIFEKIDAAGVFVADVSLVTPAESERPSPNPNVLVEWGYAMRALGPARIISVFNEHYGPVEKLPFDLRGRRVLTYECDPNVAERAGARRKLAGLLKTALSTCLADERGSNSAIVVSATRMTQLHDPSDRSIFVKVQNRGRSALFIASIGVECLGSSGRRNAPTFR